MAEPLDVDLKKVKTPPLLEDAGDEELAKEEENSFTKEHEKLQIQGMTDDLRARKNWGKRVFYLLVMWLLVVVLSVMCQGFAWWKFHVSDSVLITLITTTTANVLSLGYIVANYLFPKPKD
jgi:hypothetical protein